MHSNIGHRPLLKNVFTLRFLYITVVCSSLLFIRSDCQHVPETWKTEAPQKRVIDNGDFKIYESSPAVYSFNLKEQSNGEPKANIQGKNPSKPGTISSNAQVDKQNIKQAEEAKKQNAKPRVIAGIPSERVPFFKSLIPLKDQPLSSKLAQEEKNYYEEKYKISQYEELPFCIVVPSFKNVAKDRYLKNIRSILQQDYSNYRIIFIDDASDDGTGQKIQEYAKTHQISEKKLTIKINK